MNRSVNRAVNQPAGVQQYEQRLMECRECGFAHIEGGCGRFRSGRVVR